MKGFTELLALSSLDDEQALAVAQVAAAAEGLERLLAEVLAVTKRGASAES